MKSDPLAEFVVIKEREAIGMGYPYMLGGLLVRVAQSELIFRDGHY